MKTNSDSINKIRIESAKSVDTQDAEREILFQAVLNPKNNIEFAVSSGEISGIHLREIDQIVADLRKMVEPDRPSDRKAEEHGNTWGELLKAAGVHEDDIDEAAEKLDTVGEESAFEYLSKKSNETVLRR